MVSHRVSTVRDVPVAARAASDFNFPNDLSHTAQRPSARDVLARSRVQQACCERVVSDAHVKNRALAALQTKLAVCNTLGIPSQVALFTKERA